MKKKISYMILSFIVIFSMFIIAATCSFCGMSLDTEDPDNKISDTGSETLPVEPDNNNSRGDAKKQAASISLAVSEGPFYSAEDDVCYWRVKAKVTGNPAPAIKWSADFSNGSYGNTVAQVNLTRDNPSYTLTATAKNSEGSATDSILLFWQCDGEEGIEDEEEDDEEEVVEVFEESLDLIATGTLSEAGWEDFGHLTAFTGDDDFNNQVKGVLSFGHDEQFERLFGAEVLEARVIIPDIEIVGFPEFGDVVYVRPCHYIEFSPHCSIGAHFPIEGLENIDSADETFKEAMQYVLDNNIPQFHLILEFGGMLTNSDGSQDGLRIVHADDIVVIIRHR
ncbi:MAG: hypothetical protein JW997_02195 [Actinobacteria bacterium]|nr:hypothetical protein [Actinomycetota bacterium]